MTRRQQAGAARSSGRPASPPITPLATFIVEQLQRQAVSRATLAARLSIAPSTLSRLLSGKTHWSRLTPLALVNALGLTGIERARCLDLCEQHRMRPSHAHEPVITIPSLDKAAVKRRRSGRPAHAASSPVGRLVDPLLRERGMSRSALAQALGVKVSTVTRLLNGKHDSTHAISAAGITRALGLRGASRRMFLQQALALGAFALASGQSAPPTLRYHAFDLAQFDEDISAASYQLDAGHAEQSLQRAQDLYQAILTAPFPRTHQAAAQRRIEAALLLGRAQEAALPWYDRTLPAVRTYNHIDQEILSRFAPAQFAQQYARLYERRAPLYRELADYAESVRQFTLAIEIFMPHFDDLALLVTLYRNRAHIWAVQGVESQWRKDIDHAARMASRATGAMRSRLEGLVTYSEAEGYKRLAGAAGAHDIARLRKYALAALDSFSAARTLTQGEGPAHHVLLDVSIAQTYLFLDTSEAARRAHAARMSALSIYPALTRKIDETLKLAEANGAH